MPALNLLDELTAIGAIGNKVVPIGRGIARRPVAARVESKEPDEAVVLEAYNKAIETLDEMKKMVGSFEELLNKSKGAFAILANNMHEVTEKVASSKDGSEKNDDVTQV